MKKFIVLFIISLSFQNLNLLAQIKIDSTRYFASKDRRVFFTEKINPIYDVDPSIAIKYGKEIKDLLNSDKDTLLVDFEDPTVSWVSVNRIMKIQKSNGVLFINRKINRIEYQREKNININYSTDLLLVLICTNFFLIVLIYFLINLNINFSIIRIISVILAAFIFLSFICGFLSSSYYSVTHVLLSFNFLTILFFFLVSEDFYEKKNKKDKVNIVILLLTILMLLSLISAFFIK